MPKVAQELGAMQVQRCAASVGLHFVGGVHGLALQVTSAGAKSWILRLSVGGKRREMGLGPYPEVTLAKAREKAREARDLVRTGVDPIQRQREAASALRAAAALALTFDECADAYVRGKADEWRNLKHGQQWKNTLKTYASPVMGSLLVRDVTKAHVLAVLDPIWREKTETASRLRGRIEKVLDWAGGRELRTGPNPARWRGNLENELPDPSKVQKTEHHRALPVGEMGAFMARLRAVEGMGARALEFAILTAARSGEVRGARWAEVDMHERVWTIPAARMKAGKEHRVPLSDAAVSLLEALPRVDAGELVFPGTKGGMLSDMTMTAITRRMKVEAVPHGFRSTFRDWVAERTNYPNEAAEMALAHTIGNKVEAAYRRGDLIEKRRLMMADWAEFLARIERPAEVVKLGKRRA